jgi:putative spermidine/putrescine transport system permease protein
LTGLAGETTMPRVARRPRATHRTGISTPASLALVAPLLAGLVVLMFLPLQRLLTATGGVSGYERIVTDDLWRETLVRTLGIAAQVTAIVLVVGYGTAYAIWKLRSRRARAIVLALVAFPLLTSIVLRTYAWTAVLARNGIVNRALEEVGISDEPVKLLHTRMAVIVGIVHVLLPYAVLPIWAGLNRIDPTLLRASNSMGATNWTTFRRVVLPLSRPAVAVAGVLVFVLTLGFYITPAILGGPEQNMVANLVDQQANQFLDFDSAAQLAAILLVLTLVIIGVTYRFLAVDRLLKETS